MYTAGADNDFIKGNNMIKIKEAIIVEGRYDKAALGNIFDTIIIETRGFGIFNDAERRNFIKRIAENRGIIVLTDSDGAGFVIRRLFKGSVRAEQIKNAYIPDIYGKERRKNTASKEGKLGVEGMSREVLTEVVLRAGATVLDGADQAETSRRELTKADLYADGISGRSDSAKLRSLVLRQLHLPERLTSNALLDALNTFVTPDDYNKALENARKLIDLED